MTRGYPKLRARVAALTQDLLRVPSNGANEGRAVEVVQRHLAPISSPRVVGSTRNRPNLIYSAGPDASAAILFAAHIDTVDPNGSWSVDPFSGTRDGEGIVGLGATDNKGAVAAMVVAFERLARSAVIEKQRVVLVVNVDEERGGREGMAIVATELPGEIGAAVVAEPSGIEHPFERLWTAARGAARFSLALEGSSGHSSLVDRLEGRSAIAPLDEILRVFPAVLGQELTDVPMTDRLLLPLAVDAGPGWGRVPESATVAWELRFRGPTASREAVGAAIGRARDRVARDLGVDIGIVPAPGSLDWIPASEVAAESPVVAAAEGAWQDVLGHVPEHGCFPGGTDAFILQERGIPSLPGLGPGALVRAHAPNEYVTVQELETATVLYLRLATRFAASAEG